MGSTALGCSLLAWTEVLHPFKASPAPHLGLSELNFIEQCHWKHFPSILITKANSYLSLLAEFLCTFEFQTKVNFCYMVMHLNIFKLLETVKLCVMLPIYVLAAILFMNKATICILLIYFSVPAFSFSAVSPHPAPQRPIKILQ